jgi:hypothetical protein
MLLRKLLFCCWIFSGLAGAAFANVVAGLATVTIDSANTLDNIWFLYWDDGMFASPLTGSAPANTATQFSIGLPAPRGPQGFGIAATYTGGVEVAMNQTEATLLTMVSAPFGIAFPNFTSGFMMAPVCTETDLEQALAGMSACAGTAAETVVHLFGTDMFFDRGVVSSPVGQLATFTGMNNQASLVSFSGAANAGTVTVHLVASPEPAMWLPLAAVAGGFALRRRKPR